MEAVAVATCDLTSPSKRIRRCFSSGGADDYVVSLEANGAKDFAPFAFPAPSPDEAARTGRASREPPHMPEIVPGIAFAEPLAQPDLLLERIEREADVSAELIDDGDGAVETPRSTGWYGDAGAIYTYSGITRYPKPWTPTLSRLRDRLNAALAIELNSCLVGVYDDGTRSVDWHADDEPELRDRIVSVSLGAARTFRLRDRHGTEHAIPLAHGSVLVMSVASQQVWQHALLAEPAAGRRINLTFRVIAGQCRPGSPACVT